MLDCKQTDIHTNTAYCELFFGTAVFMSLLKATIILTQYSCVYELTEANNNHNPVQLCLWAYWSQQ